MRDDSPGVVHLELHTPDLPGARWFYAHLCGWRGERIESSSGSYDAIELGNALGGGIVQCPIPHALWLPYIEVQEIGEITDRAQRLGARAMLEPREGPTGWRSVVTTPAGGEIAFWQPKRQADRRSGR